jgi:hypothetical protein
MIGKPYHTFCVLTFSLSVGRAEAEEKPGPELRCYSCSAIHTSPPLQLLFTCPFSPTCSLVRSYVLCPSPAPISKALLTFHPSHRRTFAATYSQPTHSFNPYISIHTSPYIHIHISTAISSSSPTRSGFVIGFREGIGAYGTITEAH